MHVAQKDTRTFLVLAVLLKRSQGLRKLGLNLTQHNCFFQMRQLSQHMETIHGQLQVIIDRLPPIVDNNQPKVPSPHHQHTPGSNGVTNIETTSPLSNDEHSPDPLDDGDDNLGEGINGQERPLDAVDFRELPLLGTPESDGIFLLFFPIL